VLSYKLAAPQHAAELDNVGARPGAGARAQRLLDAVRGHPAADDEHAPAAVFALERAHD